jgi:hypothetical protein
MALQQLLIEFDTPLLVLFGRKFEVITQSSSKTTTILVGVAVDHEDERCTELACPSLYFRFQNASCNFITDVMAEWSKALCLGRSLCWRGFKSH